MLAYKCQCKKLEPHSEPLQELVGMCTCKWSGIACVRGPVNCNVYRTYITAPVERQIPGRSIAHCVRCTLYKVQQLYVAGRSRDDSILS
jgi:hypothetical protein